MFFVKLFFAVYYVITAVVPLTRVFVGSIPLYVSDLALLGALASLITLPNSQVNPLVQRGRHVVVALVMLICLTLLLNWLVSGYDLSYMVYENGRRILAILSLMVTTTLITVDFRNQSWVLNLIFWGTFAHASLIVLQGVIHYVAPSYSEPLDAFLYQTLGSIESGSRVQSRWTSDWYVPRAFGGYWNPNTAVAGLLLTAPLLFGVQRKCLRVAGVVLAITACLLTGSRQGIATVVITSLLLALRFKKISFLSLVVLLTAVAFLPKQESFERDSIPIARSVYFAEGGSVDEALYDRLGLYHEYWNNFVLKKPELLFLGRGVNFDSAIGRTDVKRTDARLGFVSNSWLLLVSSQGIFATALVLTLILGILRRMRNVPLWAALMSSTIIGLFDNHIAVMHFLQGIMWTVIGYAVTVDSQEFDYKSSTQESVLAKVDC